MSEYNASDKFNGPGIKKLPADPYAELFAGLTPEEAVQLQEEINKAEASD